jgi:hypothetical protein
MILLHRLTPFVVFLLTFLGFGMLLFYPFSAFGWSLVLFVVALFFIARLLLFDVRHTGFWVFFGLPLFVLLSSIGLFLLLESRVMQWGIALLVPFLLAIYIENLFSFYHVPSAYQAYSLEYTSLTLSLSSMFFFTCGITMAQFFLELPVWAGSLLVSLAAMMMTFFVLWTGKVSFVVGRSYVFFSVPLFFFFFFALSLLPNEYIVKAALSTVIFAAFLWYARADVLDTLSATTLRRVFSAVMLTLVILLGTALWI